MWWFYFEKKLKGFSFITWNKIFTQIKLLKCFIYSEKSDLFKSQGKDLLQNLSKKIGLSVNGGNIRKDIYED